jgi:hypothetical protein
MKNLSMLVTKVSGAVESWLRTDLIDTVGDVVTAITTGVIDVVMFFFNLLIGVVVAVYVMVDKERFLGQSKKLIYTIFKEETGDTIVDTARHGHKIFGGFLYGFAIVIALKGNASTGGTDFIALYFSNKFNKSLWQYVFVFNCILITVFGASKGWIHAGYSIVFQFISTKTISTFHTRYERLTMQITTNKPEAVLDAYIKEYHHGISCMDGYGGYSKQPFTIMSTVVSSYEVKDIIRIMKEADPKVIINIFKTEDFVGGFKPKSLD